MEELKKKLPANTICSDYKTMPNAANWIVNTTNIFAKHPKCDSLILGSLVQVEIALISRVSNSVKVNGIVQDFFHIVYTFSPKTYAFLKSNLDFRPSERYMQSLNEKKEKISPFQCSID